MASGADAVERDARLLFRYLNGDEWQEYRAILAVFAGTFFAEFTPEEVAARLTDADLGLDSDVIALRLESLRAWGNLTVSSSVGNPTSLADYYRRRNRYLITRAGQEVHDLVEGVLTRVDEVRDVSTSRLRALLDALGALSAADPTAVEPATLADLVARVFDPHQAFTTEITQFFAAINQWQSRYDLTAEEFTFFAEVLVGYVAERLDEIERLARPIGHSLRTLEPVLTTVAARSHQGLAAQVERAGLGPSIAVTRRAGSTIADWEHLAEWFVDRPTRPCRITTLGRDAVSAIRTLTLNLTRLSRVGTSAVSRRADFLRLAQWFDRADADGFGELAAAAFGMYEPMHWGSLATDAHDPVSTSTPWAQAPKAVVPVTLRERGDTTNRGRPTPLRDRGADERLVQLRRAAQRQELALIDAELLDGPLADRVLSPGALHRLEGLVARAVANIGVRATTAEIDDGSIRCRLRRHTDGLTVNSAAGTLTFHGLDIELAALADHVEATS